MDKKTEQYTIAQLLKVNEELRKEIKKLEKEKEEGRLGYTTGELYMPSSYVSSTVDETSYGKGRKIR